MTKRGEGSPELTKALKTIAAMPVASMTPRTDLNLDIKATLAGREAEALRADADGAAHTAELIRAGKWDNQSHVKCAIHAARVALEMFGKE